MKRNRNDYRRDLKKGWDLLIHTSEGIRRGLMAESGKLGSRFQKRYFDNKIEKTFCEIGKLALNLDQEDENFFAGRPDFKKRLEEVRDLLKEREGFSSDLDSGDKE